MSGFKIDDVKDMGKLLSLLYRIIWLPWRILLYIGTGIQTVFFFNLLFENTDEKYDQTFKILWLMFYWFWCVNFEIQFHILIYKAGDEHVKKPYFPPLEQRYSKEFIEKLKPDLKKLLSYSDKTEDDLQKFLKENGREGQTRYWDKCNDNKPFSMSHWSTWNRCIHRMDHHCPWANNCISLHNNRFFLSFLIWTILSLSQNFILLKYYNDTEAYRAHPYWHSFELWLNSLLTNAVISYLLFMYYINLQGRTFLEILSQGMKGPCPSKYRMNVGWREYYFLNFGTFNIFPSLLFPYFYHSPITGLEYSFLDPKTENEDFIQEHSKMLRKFFKMKEQ